MLNIKRNSFYIFCKDFIEYTGKYYEISDEILKMDFTQDPFIKKTK